MQLIRKWSIRPRGNGTLNIIETDLVGIDRVLFNLRHSVSENDARAIVVARESLALLKEFVANIDNFPRYSLGRELEVANFINMANNIIKKSEQ